MLTGNDRTVTYNPRNKPTRIESTPAVSQGNDTGVAEFIYGADDNRVVQTISSPASPAARILYVGLGDTGKSLYERTQRDTTIEHVQFIYAGGSHGGSAFALRVVTDDGSPTPPAATKYYHFDHLGSVIAISDERGHLATTSGPDANVMSYDAWGGRRNPDGTAATAASFNQQVGRREFTGHETISNVGLVNMNGRVYDPILGRFLSPDPHVQFVSDLQSFNRYSYVHNNPLRNTDPTGYFLGLSFGRWDVATGDFLGVRHQSAQQLVFEGVAIGACTTGVGCVVGGLVFTGINAEAMASQGASFGQVVASSEISLAIGGVSGTLIRTAGGDPVAQVVGGSISGGVSAAITTAAYGGDLGKNILQGAFWAGSPARVLVRGRPKRGQARQR
jgi:RHS repeat-associated protein